ncbi:flagellar assembly peptidoglycan hydrolase FlgJ [Inhella crocodyli]|uniref:Peptidoglycan hydrolase FlgJ n=1 Tax=Inhella crocodyli TaxID=2499851 RepID=A0A3S2UAR9_9BURK|nr:flagellar assembly peptidoglycan hydrolase FlgJ [Inhella crocodyli]RVT83134.1 flagellar assembly peptidoglycan hydrolase FlgJ [Inhella crocodyli]
MSQTPLNNTLAFDGQAGAALRARATRDPQGAVKDAAKQFESLFMQEVMKRMRASTLSSGLMDNETTKLGTEMLDQQFAQQLTGLPGGLSQAIERQLARNLPKPNGLDPAAATPPAPEPLPTLSKRNVPDRVAQFILKNDDAAKQVEAETGIPAQFMLAQAAHETGWGRSPIKNRDGSDSHNVFGIKAGPGWTGKVAEITTTEYINGVARKVTAKFRAYDSVEDSFRDYAKLLKGNQRYAGAVAAAESGSAQAFAQQLQRAGYATDPAYAEKLSRVINTTVRVQRALA